MPDDTSFAETTARLPARPPTRGVAAPAGATPERPAALGHVGRYALQARLGAGARGAVWSARDPLLARPIAVRTVDLDPADRQRPEVREAFLAHARAVAALRHKHIATVHDAGVDGDRAWIATDLLQGRDLRQLRAEGWRATPRQAALVCRRVADALACAHAGGVVHGGLGPGSVFMVGRTQPRVLDFGLAGLERLVRPAAAAAGPQPVLAPEQLRGEAGDARSDVFALGAVLYELLTDRRPSGGDAPAADRVEPSVPADLAALVARAMHVDAAQRFRSAGSLSRALRRWLDAQPEDGADGLPPPVAASPAAAPAPAPLIARPAPPEALAPACVPASMPAPARPGPRLSRTLVLGTLAAMLVSALVGTLVAQRTRGASAPASTAPVGAAPAVAAPPPVPASAPAVAAGPAAAPATTGTVRLEIAPWGEVEVDGVRRGATPPLAALELREGRHVVRVRNGDFAPAVRTVEVVAGRTTVLRHRFGS